MSRASISTAGIQFNSNQNDSSSSQAQSGQAMQIAILGDFSGRASRNLVDVEGVSKRRLMSVDRDNFEEIFSKLQVELSLPVSNEGIKFNEYDDLHPDYIYERIPLFDELRKLTRQLNNPDLFDRAAAEISEWSNYQKNSASEKTQQAPAEAVSRMNIADIDTSNMLDSLLSGSAAQKAQEGSPDGTINKIIKDIIAPYVEKKEDSRKESMVAAVADSANEVMRKICHDSQFQQLEASWRSLYLLIRRLETNSKLKVLLVDVSKEELLQDIEVSGGELEQSGLYKLLVSQHQVAGKTPLNLILGDFFVEDNHEDILLATALAASAHAAGAAAVCGGASIFAGISDLSKSDDPADWKESVQADVLVQWNQLREQNVAQHLSVTAPRFMLRLPYGKKTSPIESFDYEELPENGQHKYYLWGNSAYLVILGIAEMFSQVGWNIELGRIGQIEGLPLHAYTFDGESEVKPCAEILITDDGVNRFANAGLLCVRSMKDKDAILIPHFGAVAKNSSLKGPWG